ncbi:Lung seven transmembrane receptor family protein [Zea mays]|uniref:Lung seven transmembrane receptor family protein n=1 Tax=Zea mays TaxID=4577 RepID=A0A1D6HD94_MAIZE|nr:Lung seven transmembrane receptor family protein [Zea mays]
MDLHSRAKPMDTAVAVAVAVVAAALLVRVGDADITTTPIVSDARPIILFEEFGFTSGGKAAVSISRATWQLRPGSRLSSVDSSLMGFVLIASAQFPGINNQTQYYAADPGGGGRFCVLTSDYALPMLRLSDVPPGGVTTTVTIDYPDAAGLGRVDPGLPARRRHLLLRRHLPRHLVHPGPARGLQDRRQGGARPQEAHSLQALLPGRRRLPLLHPDHRVSVPRRAQLQVPVGSRCCSRGRELCLLPVRLLQLQAGREEPVLVHWRRREGGRPWPWAPRDGRWGFDSEL